MPITCLSIVICFWGGRLRGPLPQRWPGKRERRAPPGDKRPSASGGRKGSGSVPTQGGQEKRRKSVGKWDGDQIANKVGPLGPNLGGRRDGGRPASWAGSQA